MKKISLQNLIIAFCILFPFTSFSEQSTHTLSIRVKGAKANTGQVFASLFSSHENYLKKPISKQNSPVSEEGEAQFIFNELEPGMYAVSVVYDEDGNGKLNRGFMGIPSELVGFSNDVKGRFGPPSFDKTAFKFPESEAIVINLGDAKE